VARPPLRLLTFTTLFPNAAQPNHGIFVENRLRHLVADTGTQATVLAPTWWFPSANPRFGTWAAYARVPREEQRHGLAVHHPRALTLPKLGMYTAPYALYRAARRELHRLLAQGLRFDAIDAHYLYPDGVAALWLARAFRKPLAITARGSDVTELPDYAIPRALIRRAIEGADALIAVSAGLKRRLVELGAPENKVTVLRNGIDTALFHPGPWPGPDGMPSDRAAMRARLGLAGPTLISVGGLIPRKRHHLAIDAMALLPGATLLILGAGPEHAALEARAAQRGVADRVRLLGPRPHAELPAWYAAADLSILASSREGWANVLLESMACGTPVVASDIPGNPEVVQRREAGLILRENSAEGIAEAVQDLLATPPDRAATRRYAEGFGWAETSAGQLALFRRITGIPE
jgi:teichuronic acid biosynthesis glycosyltransferase TuaC